MISCAHVRDLALYNKWQSETVYALCTDIGDDERRKGHGIFFKSIHNLSPDSLAASFVFTLTPPPKLPSAHPH